MTDDEMLAITTHADNIIGAARTVAQLMPCGDARHGDAIDELAMAIRGYDRACHTLPAVPIVPDKPFEAGQ